jgi:hypothetical protein
MFDTLIASLVSKRMFGRERHHNSRGSDGLAPAPGALDTLSDHTLRDLGFRREPAKSQRVHLMRF